MIRLWSFVAAIGLALTGCGRTPSADLPTSRKLGTSELMQSARAVGIDLSFPPLDSSYLTLDPAWVARHLQPAINAAMGLYRVPTADCDDFSRAAAHFAASLFNEGRAEGAPAYGQIFVLEDSGTRHALNWFISHGGEVYFHEPQTGKVWLPTARETQGVLYAWI